MKILGTLIIRDHGQTLKVDEAIPIDSEKRFYKIGVFDVDSNIKYAIVDSKLNQITEFCFKDIYVDTYYNKKIIVRSIYPPFLSGVADLSDLANLQYSVPMQYFKILYWEGVGYLLVLAPCDCKLVDLSFISLIDGRHNKIEKTDDPKIFKVTNFGITTEITIK